LIAPLATPSAETTAPPAAWIAAAARAPKSCRGSPTTPRGKASRTGSASPVRGLIARVAVPAPAPETFRRLRDLELRAIARVPAEDLLAGAFDPPRSDPTTGSSWTARRRDPRRARALLAVHPAHRTLAFLDAAACAKWGIARAVRSGS
jgi:hypothetical protein